MLLVGLEHRGRDLIGTATPAVVAGEVPVVEAETAIGVLAPGDGPQSFLEIILLIGHLGLGSRHEFHHGVLIPRTIGTPSRLGLISMNPQDLRALRALALRFRLAVTVQLTEDFQLTL